MKRRVLIRTAVATASALLFTTSGWLMGKGVLATGCSPTCGWTGSPGSCVGAGNSSTCSYCDDNAALQTPPGGCGTVCGYCVHNPPYCCFQALCVNPSPLVGPCYCNSRACN